MLPGERHMMRVEFKGQIIDNFTLLPQQGFSNENYSFTLDNKTYLLRQFKLKDRGKNLTFKPWHTKRAWLPNPMLEEGYMICDFLEGHHEDRLKFCTGSNGRSIKNTGLKTE